MAIALDTTGAIDSASGVTQTLDLSLTVAGSDRALVVGAWVLDGSDLLSTLTFNGTTVPVIQKTIMGSDRWIYLGVLAAPSTGTHNVSMAISGGVDKLLALVAASYTGCDASPVDNSNIGSTPTTDHRTSSLTPVADNCWVVEVGSAAATPVDVSTGITQRAITGDFGNGSGFYRLLIGDSNAAIHPAASTSMTITTSNSASDVASAMVSLAPVGGGGSPSVALTGTITASIAESDIVTGGKTIILTLTNDSWIP